eukprot:2766287-Prorocentrum_lima.AAC.1
MEDLSLGSRKAPKCTTRACMRPLQHFSAWKQRLVQSPWSKSTVRTTYGRMATTSGPSGMLKMDLANI